MSEKAKNTTLIIGLLFVFGVIMWGVLSLNRKHEQQYIDQQEFYTNIIQGLNNDLANAKASNDSSQSKHSEKIKTVQVIKYKQIIKYETLKAATDTLSFDSAGRLYKELLRYYKDKEIY